MRQSSKSIAKAATLSKEVGADRRSQFLAIDTEPLSSKLSIEQSHFERSPLAFALVSADGSTLLKVNNAFAEMHGLSVNALRGATLESLVVPEDRLSFAKHIEQARGMTNYGYECTHLRISPEQSYQAQVDISQVCGPSYNVLYLDLVVQDVTLRTRREDEMRANESRYRSLVERCSSIIYETDTAGHFTYVNIPSAHKFLGYSVTELRSMCLFNLVHASYRATVAAVYQQQADRRSLATHLEFPVCTKQGAIIWIGQDMILAAENGRAVRHTASARDITESKRTKQRTRQRQLEFEDLQDWYVATQTAVALAHDLNQPLNAVCSYNEAALRMLKSGNPYPDKLLHALNSSVQQSERAGKVMRNLLGFLVKGHLPLTKKAVDLNGVVRQTLVDMDEEARAADITLVTKLCAKLGVAFAHRLHIEKVLCNLLRNSIEAIRGNNDSIGTIVVETARQKEFALVTVRDSGPGFSNEQAAVMLEPFNTSKERGVGMGLPVSRSLIEAHGGKLWVESGVGATIRFTVPFA